MDIVAVVCEIDDFCQAYEPKFNLNLISSGERKRIKPSQMSRSDDKFKRHNRHSNFNCGGGFAFCRFICHSYFFDHLDVYCFCDVGYLGFVPDQSVSRRNV